MILLPLPWDSGHDRKQVSVHGFQTSELWLPLVWIKIMYQYCQLLVWPNLKPREPFERENSQEKWLHCDQCSWAQ